MQDGETFGVPGRLTSYPDKYQVRVRTVKGVDIFIRPLLAGDPDLLKEFPGG